MRIQALESWTPFSQLIGRRTINYGNSYQYIPLGYTFRQQFLYFNLIDMTILKRSLFYLNCRKGFVKLDKNVRNVSKLNKINQDYNFSDGAESPAF